MSLITTTNHQKGPRRFQKETVLEIAEKTKRKQTVQCKRMIFLTVDCIDWLASSEECLMTNLL